MCMVYAIILSQSVVQAVRNTEEERYTLELICRKRISVISIVKLNSRQRLKEKFIGSI